MTPLPDVLPPQVACPACTPSDDHDYARCRCRCHEAADWAEFARCRAESRAMAEKWKKEHPWA